MEWFLQHGERIGIITVLGAALIFMFRAWMNESFMSAKTHLRELAAKDTAFVEMVKHKDKQIEDTKEECKFQREMNEQLLDQLRRTITAQETVAEVVKTRRRS